MTLPSRIEGDGRGRLRAVLRACLAALRGGEHGGDVAHVGDAGLDRGGVADAVEPPVARASSRRALQLVEPAVARGDVDARADSRRNRAKRAGRGAIGKGVRRDQIAPDHVERIEAEFDRDPLHQPLERDNRPAGRRSRGRDRSASCW